MTSIVSHFGSRLSVMAQAGRRKSNGLLEMQRGTMRKAIEGRSSVVWIKECLIDFRIIENTLKSIMVRTGYVDKQ